MRPAWGPVFAVLAGLIVTAMVAAGVTLAILHVQSPTNPQQVNLRPGVTLTQDSAIVQAAAKGRPAVAGANGLTVLVPGDSTSHAARLVDYDCQTGVAVVKIDKVSGLPTLVFADPTALVQGQVIVAVGGPVEGGAVTPGYVSAMHRVL